MLNNCATHHFQKLAHHIMKLLARVEKSKGRAAQQAANAVTFLRLIMKHLTENLNASQLVAFVNDEAPTAGVGVPNGSSTGAFTLPDLQPSCKVLLDVNDSMIKHWQRFTTSSIMQGTSRFWCG